MVLQVNEPFGETSWWCQCTAITNRCVVFNSAPWLPEFLFLKESKDFGTKMSNSASEPQILEIARTCDSTETTKDRRLRTTEQATRLTVSASAPLRKEPEARASVQVFCSGKWTWVGPGETFTVTFSYNGGVLTLNRVSSIKLGEK